MKKQAEIFAAGKDTIEQIESVRHFYNHNHQAYPGNPANLNGQVQANNQMSFNHKNRERDMEYTSEQFIAA